MSRILPLALLALASTPAWGAPPPAPPGGEEVDPRISPEQLPEPVLAAVEARWAGAEIDRVVMEKKNYAIELSARGGGTFSALVTPKGKIKRVAEVTPEEPDELEPGDGEEEEPEDDG